MSWWDQLRMMDREAFLAINGAHAPWADQLMWAISDLRLWIPLYLFFLFLIQRKWGWRGLGLGALVIGLMIFCSDSGSVMLFKESVQRLRPSHAPELQGTIHLLPGPDGQLYRGGRYGFVSSHASNHFAIALFLIGVLRGLPRWGTLALLCWAAIISYSRVYIGVHYPGDVIAGGLYGAFVGFLSAWLFNRFAQRLPSSSA